MAPPRTLIYGEPPHDLIPGLTRMIRSFRLRSDGTAQFIGPLGDPDARPLARALHRAEAELLLADAELMIDPEADERRPELRRGAALASIAYRVDAAVPAGNERAPFAAQLRSLLGPSITPQPGQR